MRAAEQEEYPRSGPALKPRPILGRRSAGLEPASASPGALLRLAGCLHPPRRAASSIAASCAGCLLRRLRPAPAASCANCLLRGFALTDPPRRPLPSARFKVIVRFNERRAGVSRDLSLLRVRIAPDFARSAKFGRRQVMISALGNAVRRMATGPGAGQDGPVRGGWSRCRARRSGAWRLVPVAGERGSVHGSCSRCTGVPPGGRGGARCGQLARCLGRRSACGRCCRWLGNAAARAGAAAAGARCWCPYRVTDVALRAADAARARAGGRSVRRCGLAAGMGIDAGMRP
jgi:hypothetical protein